MIEDILYALLIVASCAASLGWAVALTTRGERDRARADAVKWEQIAGDVARDSVYAKQYARVAMPAPEPQPDVEYQYDPTGLIRVTVPRSPNVDDAT